MESLEEGGGGDEIEKKSAGVTRGRVEIRGKRERDGNSGCRRARIHFTSSRDVLRSCGGYSSRRAPSSRHPFPFHPGKRRLFALSRELIDIVDLLARRHSPLSFSLARVFHGFFGIAGLFRGNLDTFLRFWGERKLVKDGENSLTVISFLFSSFIDYVKAQAAKWVKNKIGGWIKCYRRMEIDWRRASTEG